MSRHQRPGGADDRGQVLRHGRVGDPLRRAEEAPYAAGVAGGARVMEAVA